MLLSRILGEMLAEYRNISRVDVRCNPEDREYAAEWFEKRYMFYLGVAAVLFAKEYKVPVLKDPFRAEDDYYGFFPEDPPFEVVPAEDGFMIRIHELEIRSDNGDFYFPGYGEKAFSRALKDLKKRFEGLAYGGCVNYMLQDNRDGHLVSYEIKDEQEKNAKGQVWPWVGEGLRDMFASQGYTLDEEEPLSVKEAAGTIRCLEAYHEWIPEAVIRKVADKLNGMIETGD